MPLPTLNANNYFFVTTRFVTNKTGLKRKQIVDLVLSREAMVWRLDDKLQHRFAVSFGGYTFVVLKDYKKAPDGVKHLAGS